jgi:chaperonin cofactor prefoldin
MIPESINLIWYNLERNFLEMQVKCDMIDLSIETLQKYKESLERSLELMKGNLTALMKMHGGPDGASTTNQQPQQKM